MQAVEEGKAFGWRAFWRRLQEIKSPQPHFKKVVVSKTSLRKGGGVKVPEGNPSPELLNSLSSLSNSTLSLKGRGRVKNSRFTRRKAAFTLAEVLITLGIIGVVAAMTLPALIQKNNNRVVETRLMKFYSAMNQAIKLAEVDYGDRSYWFQDLYGVDDDGNSKIQPWIEKYFVPYLKVIKTDVNAEGRVTLYFADGGAMRSAIGNGRDWIYFVGDPDRCEKIGNGNYYHYIGRCAFAFYYNPTDGNKHTQGWHFEPYAAGWDGTESSLKSHPNFGCITKNASATNWHSYCTKWIQYNGWKIPDEYPYKVYYK